MNVWRHTFFIAAVGLAAITTAQAGDVSMANGDVHFSTPDNWVSIMETQGDPEARVFQVPDPSPSATVALARISVTVKQASNQDDFNNYISGATAKAQALKNYASTPDHSANPNRFSYTASENGEPFTYVEQYWFRNGHAIQLRCVRPSQSQAGGAWTASFDKGCQKLAASLGS